MLVFALLSVATGLVVKRGVAPAKQALRASAVTEGSVATLHSSIDSAPLPAAAELEPAAPRSACIFGWFFATDKELAFVEKKYREAGFDDVTIVPSEVPLISRPRGWYNTFFSRHVEQNTIGSPLARSYDVVHCLSGGFLNLYLARAAGIPIRYKTLVMDSTPILPTPAAYTRFVRAFLASVGMKKLLAFYPRVVHQSLVWFRWVFGAAWARTKHMILRRATKPAVDESATAWLHKFSNGVFVRGYVPLIETTLNEVFGEKETAVRFVYNPEDPFISQDDLNHAIQHARSLGCAVEELQVPTNHVQTIFRRPKIWLAACDATVQAA